MTHILLSRSILGSVDFQPFFRPYIKSGDRVTVLLFSFFENQFKDEEAYDKYYEINGEYHQKIIGSFTPYGIQEKNIEFIHYFKDDSKSAKQKIQCADILYFPGGAPDMMMKRIELFNIKKDLESHQKLFIGSSAGTMIQFKRFHISKDGEYHRFSYHNGLDLIEDIDVEVHYRRRKQQKKAMRKTNRDFGINIYGIPDDGAIIYHNHQIITVGTARQIYSKKGKCKAGKS
ncbi:MAG: Type 1 glutamine amidotransferase-like domain-containing protein [Acholeplasmataceae bacterium]|nr:Type 1 glutamine amidotransferase-like domain-containing protein [Acholeplasmataceae bacterium]